MSTKYLSPSTFSLSIGGKSLTDTQKKHVISITLENKSTFSSIATIKVNDPDLTWLGDKKIFIEKTKVKIKINHSGQSTTFTGYVVTMTPDISGDIPSLTINCMDESYRLDVKKVSKNWGSKVKRSDIAKSIFKKHGLKAVISTSVNKETTTTSGKKSTTEKQDISQSKETDMEFLKKLAGEEAYDWLCYVKGGVGYYCKKTLIQSPVATLQYRKGNYQITKFRPTIKKSEKRAPVYKQDYNISTGKPTTSKPVNSDTQGITISISSNTSSSKK